MLLQWLARLGMDDLAHRALAVLPLMPIAWADGSVHPAEEQVIREFATRFDPRPEDWLLIDDWLLHPPSDSYVHRGHAALAMLAGRQDAHLSLPAGVADGVRDAARRLARAHGGLFGIGAVSRRQARALRALDALLADPPPLDVESLPARRVTIALEGRARAALQSDDEVLPIDEARTLTPGNTLDGLPRIRREGRHWLLDAGSAEVRVDGQRTHRRRLLGGELVEVGHRRMMFRLVRRQPQTVTG